MPAWEEGDGWRSPGWLGDTMAKLPKRHTPEETRALAESLLKEQVITMYMPPVDLVKQVFLPVGFGVLDIFTKAQLAKIMVYGVLGEDLTTGMAINGWPMFTQCHLCHLADFQRAVEMYERAKTAQEEAMKSE